MLSRVKIQDDDIEQLCQVTDIIAHLVAADEQHVHTVYTYYASY